MAIKVIPKITPSSLELFNTCRLQWYWKNPMGYRTKGRDFNLDLGIGIHDALAEYYRGFIQHRAVDPVEIFTKWVDNEIRRLDPQWQDDIATMTEVRTLGITMLEGYLDEYQDEPFDVLEVEKTVEKDIPGTDWTLEARIDAIVQDKAPRRGKKYVLEHKTFTRLEVDQLDRDHQFVAEAWLAEDLIGEPLAGVLYNGLRKQIPSPKVKNKLFERHYVMVNRHQIEVLLKRCRSMYNMLTKDRLSIYPEPSNVKCSMCSFKQPCLEYMRGGDYQFLLDHLYTKRPDEVVIEEEK